MSRRPRKRPSSSVKLGSCGEWVFVGGVGFEGAVDDVGEAAFEDAEGFESAVAL